MVVRRSSKKRRVIKREPIFVFKFTVEELASMRREIGSVSGDWHTQKFIKTMEECLATTAVNSSQMICCED